MSVHYIHPHRIAQTMRDPDAVAHRDAIDAAEYVRARAVPEKSKWGIVFIGAASAALWAILLLCAVYAVNLVVVS